MSLVALKIMAAALLLLQLHACNARHTFDLVSYTKLQDADAEKTKLVHHEIMDVKGFHVFKDTKYASSVLSVATLEDNTRPARELQGLKGKPRSMVESESHDETKEATDANEGEPVEDAVVMDYVLPHRKSPIHNHH